MVGRRSPARAVSHAVLLAILPCALSIRPLPIAADEPAAAIAPAAAVRVSGRVEVSGGATIDGGCAQSIPAEGEAGIDVETAASRRAKGLVSITIDHEGTVELERAYLKARFPILGETGDLRLTAGKAPLAWGKGFVFNAGDLVFDPVPDFTSFTSDEYRTEADWMIVGYAPFSAFSFVELVYLPPVDDGAANRAGGRLFVTPDLSLLQSIEAGFVYDEAASRAAYLAVAGSLLVDYYASASWDFDLEELIVSAGLFRVIAPSSRVPVTVRAECLWYPDNAETYWYPAIEAAVLDELSVGVQALFVPGNNRHALPEAVALVATAKPIEGLTLWVSAVRPLASDGVPEALLGYGIRFEF